ncbi:MAG: YfiR family protein [Gammaproteobacteria bacterium]
MAKLACQAPATSAPLAARRAAGRALAWLGVLVLGLCGAAAAQAAPTELELKAALLHKFAMFVEWPEGSFADATTTLGVCVLAAAGVGDALDSLSEQPIKGRTIDIRRLPNALAPSADCHVAFIGELKPRELAAVLAGFHDRSVLTVGDAPGFADSGGILGFKTMDKKLRFDINLDAASRAGLVISSQVLRLATVISSKPR